MENNNVNVEDVKVEGGATNTEDTEVKSYTQEQVDELLKGYKSKEEVNKIIDKKFAQWSKKTEEAKAEAERLATMSAEEKAKHDFEKKVAEFEAREKELARKELAIETDKQLKDLGISTKATKFVLGIDADATHENIKEFSQLVEDIKADVKHELLKGKTPKSSVSNIQSITKDDFRKMTYPQRVEIQTNNPTLYSELIK